MSNSSHGIRRVQEVLAEQGLTLDVTRFPSSTRTAGDAARTVGCEVAQIAKSLLFRARNSAKPVLVVASGANRVDLAKASTAAGEPLKLADPDFVRERTGFEIGGVPPMGHREAIETYLDRDLFAFSEVWAAAGAPDAVFPLAPEQLQQLTSGVVIDVK